MAKTEELKKEARDNLEEGFHQVDLNNISAEQLVPFLTPFIELAGFQWEVRIKEDGQKLLTIAKHLN